MDSALIALIGPATVVEGGKEESSAQNAANPNAASNTVFSSMLKNQVADVKAQAVEDLKNRDMLADALIAVYPLLQAGQQAVVQVQEQQTGATPEVIVNMLPGTDAALVELADSEIEASQSTLAYAGTLEDLKEAVIAQIAVNEEKEDQAQDAAALTPDQVPAIPVPATPVAMAAAPLKLVLSADASATDASVEPQAVATLDQLLAMAADPDSAAAVGAAPIVGAAKALKVKVDALPTVSASDSASPELTVPVSASLIVASLMEQASAPAAMNEAAPATALKAALPKAAANAEGDTDNDVTFASSPKDAGVVSFKEHVKVPSPQALLQTAEVADLDAPTPVGSTVQPGASSLLSTASTEATHVRLSTAPLPGSPAEQVSVQLRHLAKDGGGQIHLQLEPLELGRLTIHVDILPDKHAHMVISADQPDTLIMLQSDVKTLERTLSDAGLKTDGTNIHFQLGSQGEHSGRSHHQQAATRYDGTPAAEEQQAADPWTNLMLSAQEGVDIRV